MTKSGSPTSHNILLLLQFLLVYFVASAHAGNEFQGNLKRQILSCKYVCKWADMSVCGVRETTVVLRKIPLRRASIFFLPKQTL